MFHSVRLHDCLLELMVLDDLPTRDIAADFIRKVLDDLPTRKLL
jgi:hypothetical protein